MVDKKKGGILVDDMRDYALITLMKTIRRLELLDEKRNNESDITKIRRYIGMFVQKAFNGKTEENNANSVFDKFPEVLEIAEEKDEAKADTLTKELMKTWRKALLNQITEYKKLSENDCETVILNAEKVYDEVFKPYIETHNKARRNKDNQIDRKEFVKSVMSGDMNEDVERIVLSAKENVIKKLKERKSDTQSKPLFKEEINSVVQGLDVSYSISRNSDAVKQANRKVRSYFSKADAASYRKDYPKDFTARPIKEGSKEDALMYQGCLASAGYNQVHLGIRPSADSFNDFKRIIKKNYPHDSEEVINKSLGIAKNAGEDAQFEAFSDVGASYYTQLLGGFIDLRKSIVPNEPVNSNIVVSLKKYIDGMSAGVQDVHVMSLLLPENDSGRGTVKQEQSKEQHTNMDHSNIPVAAAIQLYIKLHPELGGNLEPNKLKLDKLLDLAEKAAPLVDNIANHRLVVSKAVNDLLEPNGQFILGKKKDNSILAVRYSLPKIQEVLGTMFGSDSKKLERYKEAFAKYSKADKRGIITTNLNLPEHSDITKARKENSSDKNILDIRVVTENALTIGK
ncbi:MAG: hypothetical protein IJ677_08175 [Alphaproteobacteria bacterium]|nr:hypothetical protein [Alphaproteobacteria bacterium]